MVTRMLRTGGTALLIILMASACEALAVREGIPGLAVPPE